MESTAVKHFVIASGPTAIRLTLSEEIAQRYPERLALKSYALYKDSDYDGVNTDYRYQLKLAADQATWVDSQAFLMPVLFSHSLLDSLAYTTLTVERHATFDNVSPYTRDKWLLVFALIGSMFRDSFRADEVFFLDVFAEGDNFAYLVQSRVKMILDEFGIKYHTLKVNDSLVGLLEQAEVWADKIGKIIEPHLPPVSYETDWRDD